MMGSFFEGLDVWTDFVLGMEELRLHERANVFGQPPQYQHRGVAMAFFNRKPRCDLTALIAATFGQMSLNRAKWPGNPGAENWRCVPQLHLDPNNQAPEVCLERAIANLNLPGWCNQIPVCSGYCGPNADGARHLDLASSNNDKSCTFIELKVDPAGTHADNPLFAAVELLRYYCACMYTRVHREQLCKGNQHLANLANPWMCSKQVSLKVLAPSPYYAGYAREGLRWFEASLTKALRSFVGSPLLPGGVEFRFTQFAERFGPAGDQSWRDFLWRQENGDWVVADPENLEVALREIKDVCPS